MSEDAWLGPQRPRWTVCTHCNGTGKSAGMDCPDCRVGVEGDEGGGIPTGWVRADEEDT